ncbi:MAG: bifunctional [glutamine synthetase] adenylyltransferase/[glutamine synthetase]-adenylyl-L-tyrosine phosphorylase [Sphingopyxis sp.]
MMPLIDPATHRDATARRMARHAPFLAMLADQRPALVARFIEQGSAAAIAACRTVDGTSSATIMASLRHRRADLALTLALADLSAEMDLAAITRALSDFADEACEAALGAAFADRAPGEPVQGVAVIALGKMGSHELNYSSDIDPILIFDPQTMPRRSRDDAGEAAVRLARRWMEILSQRTGDGHVQRVDLRLRPSPEVTPIILPVEAAISYYESHALAWEQAAFIRSRACAGDRALGDGFLHAIQPFIWRRSMDFGQLRRIADISQRIRGHYADGQVFGLGFDLKRGRGGIREVEFFAQVQQLIHGGRNPALRTPATCDALAALAVAGHVPGEVAAALAAHYTMLRTIEHRLQMVADQQTHRLPDTTPALDNVAQLHDLADGAALLAALAHVVDQVGQQFDRLIGLSTGAGADHWPMEGGAMARRAAELGFADTAFVVRRVDEWRSGASRVLRSPAARDALEIALPPLMAALGRAADPAVALGKFDALVNGLPSAVNFFNLLAARPQLLSTLVAVLSHAPPLAQELSVRAELIEGLIDSSVFHANPTPDALAARMAAGPVDDLERQLDHVRRVVGEQRFALGVQLVQGSVDPLDAARGYADLADAALHSLTSAAIANFERAHGRVPGGELLVLALGRYGGQALTHASDLDLILLFTGDHLAESDGPRPLGATTYFNRLGQRVIAALSVPTAAGRLYEVDVRLRPQGNDGPLVAMLDAFARYQRDSAWTWEHMALTRARPVFGSPSARAAVQRVIDDTLNRPRDHGALLADIGKMRGDVATHKPPKSALDVKLVPGGLVDCEFAIHACQLDHRTAFDPRLNVALQRLIAAGLAPDAVGPAMDLLGRMLVAMRLMAPNMAVDDAPTRARIAQCCGFSGVGDDGGWDEMLAAYDAARQSIGPWWNSVRTG